MQLQNKNIVITGGAQGLGKATARLLAAQGAKLVLIDRNAETLASTAAELRDIGATVATYAANIAQEADVVAVFQQIRSETGVIDGLVNNAGIIRDGLLLKKTDSGLEKFPVADWQSVIDVNLTGSFLCGREAAWHMATDGNGGCIVNISSISRAGNIGQSNYAAAKSGVTALTVTWAKELARYGIRVAAIAPGFIATDMTAQIKPDVIAKIEAGIPLKRMGKPDAIARTVQFILENDYVTGRVIEVDGGLRL